MRHVVCVFANAHAILDRADVAFDEIETRPLRRFNESLHLVEIALVAGREIVKAGDALIKLQKRLQQIRANESRRPGDRPVPRRALELTLCVFEPRHRRNTLFLKPYVRHTWLKDIFQIINNGPFLAKGSDAFGAHITKLVVSNSENDSIIRIESRLLN